MPDDEKTQNAKNTDWIAPDKMPGAKPSDYPSQTMKGTHHGNQQKH